MRHEDRIARSIDPQHSSLAQMGASPSSLMAIVQRDRVIFEALRTLPLDVQIAVELHYWESMTLVEIAAVLECPLGTAKTRLRRGRQLLESALASRLDHKDVV